GTTSGDWDDFCGETHLPPEVVFYLLPPYHFLGTAREAVCQRLGSPELSLDKAEREFVSKGLGWVC
ncbi:MAG TPA: hypothetical protein VNK95_14960, partial [Caldilineaceae bacterium]|nr:hypothetical protein [Caldilineaceae bacterium]